MRKFSKHLAEGLAYNRKPIIANVHPSQKIKITAAIIIVLE